MPTSVSEAILLRAVDYSESDRIVHLLTPDDGRLAAIAKGARRSVRRFPGTLDLFNHLRIEVNRRRRGLAYLEQAVLISAFPALRTLPSRFGLGCYLIELLDRLAPEGGAGPDVRRLFEFAEAALRALEDSVPDPRLRVLLELRALDALGLRPELRRCVRCGREPAGGGRVGFHVADGGVVCGDCGAGLPGLLPVSLGTLRALEQGLRFELGALGRVGLGPTGLSEAGTLVHRFQRFHVGIELRSSRFLDTVLGWSPAGSA